MSPNDPKLSDCGVRRAGCGKVAGAGWAQVAGWSAAASVTRGAVRCSAWFGVAGVGKRQRATTGQKRESALRMEVSDAYKRRSVETGEARKAEKLGCTETVERCERQTAVLGEDVELGEAKARDLGPAIDSETVLTRET